MSRDDAVIATLRSCWAIEAGKAPDSDYVVLGKLEGAYAGRSASGLPALLIPLAVHSEGSTGRRASGFELIPHRATKLVVGSVEVTGPAAALVCVDPSLIETFAVLAADVARRARDEGAIWSNLIAIVEEWQTLLTPRGRPSPEAEAGLWGELWFATQADDIDRILECWRGPERDATDFFLAGKSVEVKTARQRRQHHVSLSQVDAPVGTHEAWFLSIWVKVDPGTAVTVQTLAEGILSRVLDRGDGLRRLARAGYSPTNRAEYTTSFTVLAQPEWYAAADIPRVRVADPGVSQLRYRVSLDEERRADEATSDSLWRHFHRHPYGGAGS